MKCKRVSSIRKSMRILFRVKCVLYAQVRICYSSVSIQSHTQTNTSVFFSTTLKTRAQTYTQTQAQTLSTIKLWQTVYVCTYIKIVHAKINKQFSLSSFAKQSEGYKMELQWFCMQQHEIECCLTNYSTIDVMYSYWAKGQISTGI